MLKVVIINDLGQRHNKSALIAENTTAIPKTDGCFLYIVSHNFESLNAGLVGVKKDFN